MPRLQALESALLAAGAAGHERREIPRCAEPAAAGRHDRDAGALCRATAVRLKPDTTYTKMGRLKAAPTSVQ
jgi:hypothetical protein